MKWRIAFLAGLIIILSLLILHIFSKDRGYPAYMKLKKDISTVKNANEALRKENEGLYTQTLYRKSEIYNEEIARTQLGYAQPDEQIVRWVNPTPTSPEEKRPENSVPTARSEIQH